MAIFERRGGRGFCRMAAFFCMLGGAMCAFMPAARASMVFCNHTQGAFDVAFGYHEGKEWASDGWWRIEPSQCARVYKKTLTERYYFYYVATPDAAERAAQTLTSGVYRFCVGSKAFHSKDNKDCPASGYEDKGFEALDIGAGQKNYVFNLKN